jgi:trk system potassium uptake protein TrkH
MVIGASPSGTGGGLKTTTFSAVIGVVRSAIKGLDRVYFWGREIPPQRVWVAFASLGFYLFFVVAGCYALALFENFGFEAILFEVASGLGTVGLSTGITAALSPMGKLIIIFLMFIGRLGPLAFGMSLYLSQTGARPRTIEDLAL